MTEFSGDGPIKFGDDKVFILENFKLVAVATATSLGSKLGYSQSGTTDGNPRC